MDIKKVSAVLCFAFYLILPGMGYCRDINEKFLNVCVPEKFGIIQEVHHASSSAKWVIFIQDAHANYYAQKNIKHIINACASNDFTDIICIEGSAGLIDTSPLKSYPDKKVLSDVSEYLLKSALITGFEDFSIRSDYDIPLCGIESPDEYEENLMALRDGIDLFGTNSRIIERLRLFLDTEKESIESPQLLTFLDKKYQFNEANIDIEEYSLFLSSEFLLSEGDYPEITKIKRIQSIRENLDFDKAEKETYIVLQKISQWASAEKKNSCDAATLQFKLGNISARTYYGTLANIIKSMDRELPELSQLFLYTSLLETYYSLSHIDLQIEIKNLETEFIERYASNEHDRSLFELEALCNTLEQILNFQISRSEIDSFISSRDDFSAKHISRLIRNVNPIESVNLANDVDTLFVNLRKADRFYSLALQRDAILVDNMLQQLESHKAQSCVLIAGGFHSQGMTRLLDNAGINYLLVKPKIQSIEKSNLYVQHAIDQSSKLETFIDHALSSLALTRWLAQYPLGMNQTQQKAKLLQCIALLLTAHLDSLTGEYPNEAFQQILDRLNSAINSFDSRNIIIRSIKRYPEYRMYEVEINGKSLYYYFKSAEDPQASFAELVVGDIQSILARDIEVGENEVSVLTEDIVPTVLSAPLLTAATDSSSTEHPILEWARQHDAQSTRSVNLDNSVPTIITIDIQDGVYNVYHLQLIYGQADADVLHHDAIPVSSMQPQYLWHLIQVLKESVQMESLLLPHILITNQDQVIVVPIDNKQDFLSHLQPILEHTEATINETDTDNKQKISEEDPLKLNYVAFSSSLEDDPATTDEQLISKLELLIKYDGPGDRLSHLALTSPNKRILRLLASEAFYEKTIIRKGSKDEFKILRDLVSNPKTPVDALEAIANRPYLYIMLFLEKGAISQTSFIYRFVNHENVTPQIIDKLTTVLLKIEQAVDNDKVDSLERYTFKDGSIVERPIWYADERQNLRNINSFLDVIIAHRLTPIDTIKLIKDKADFELYIQIARSTHYPELIIDDIEQGMLSDQLANYLTPVYNALTENYNISPDIIRKLLSLDDMEITTNILYMLTRNEQPLTNSATLEQIEDLHLALIAKNNWSVTSVLAASKRPLSGTIINKLLDMILPSNENSVSRNISLLASLATREELTEEQIEKLYMHYLALEYDQSNDHLFIKQLLLNKKINPPFMAAEYVEWLKAFEEDPNVISIFSAVAQKRGSLPEEVIDYLMNFSHNDDFVIRGELAKRYDLPQSVFLVLYDDPSPYVRGMIAGNRSTPLPILELIAQRNDTAHISDSFKKGENHFRGIQGIDEEDMKRIVTENKTVMECLAENRGIVNSPVEIVKPLMQDPKYSQSVIASISVAKAIALDYYNQGNLEMAYRMQTPLVTSHDYAPFGALFDYANTLYSISQVHEKQREVFLDLARESYENSVATENNINSFAALLYLDRLSSIPQYVLNEPIFVQFILQNFHSARAFTKDDFDQLDQFLAYPWDTFEYSGDLAIVTAIIVHTLSDSIEQGVISSAKALSIFNSFLYIDAANYSPEKWSSLQEGIVKRIIFESNLNPMKKSELLNSPALLAEFYLRKGPGGIISYQSFNSFYESLILDNVPPYLRQDIAKSVWLELHGLTDDLLFVEPHFFTLVRMITTNGDFLEYADRLRFNMSFASNDIDGEAGDINSVLKSELGHAISYATSKDAVRNSSFEEFQDRSASLKLPVELQDPSAAKEIVNKYARHDNMMISLYQSVLEDIPELLSAFDNLELFNINMEYTIKNARVALDYANIENTKHDPLAQRLIGEAVYITYHQNEIYQRSNNHLDVLIGQIELIRKEIREFPWDVRVFFEGGIYAQTYQQSFSQLMPPVDVIVGDEVNAQLQDQQRHYVGEWLNYLYRMRIRELLRRGDLSPPLLPVFYRTSALFMNHLVYDNSEEPKLAVITDKIRSLTPSMVFDPIKNRNVVLPVEVPNISPDTAPARRLRFKQFFSIDGTGSYTDIASAKHTILSNIAEPEKLVLRSVGKMLNSLYADNILSFNQFVKFLTAYYQDVYQLHIDVSEIDFSNTLNYSKQFMRHFMFSFMDVGVDMKPIADFLVSQLLDADAVNSVSNTISDTSKISSPESIYLSPMASQKIAPFLAPVAVSRLQLKQHALVIDFDSLFTTDDTTRQTELLMAFKYTYLLQDKNIQQDLKIVFYSQTLSTQALKAVLSNYFDQTEITRFMTVSSNDLKTQGTTLSRYIDVPANNVVLFADSSSALRDVFLPDGAVAFELNTTATQDLFAPFFQSASALFDFLERGAIPEGTQIRAVAQSSPYSDFFASKETSVTFDEFSFSAVKDIPTMKDIEGMTFVISQTKVDPVIIKPISISRDDLIKQSL